jgi:hypothetical protein
MEELIIGIVVTLVGSIIIGLIVWIGKKNILYYSIIREFKEKLPRPQNQGRVIPEEEKKRYFLPEYIQVIDVSPHKTSLSESELDVFYNKLNNFDYSFVLFKNHYRGVTENLNRFKPKSENKNFDLIMIQKILEEDDIHPLKFSNVFVYHLKWKWKLTSFFYTWKIRKKQRDVLRKTK